MSKVFENQIKGIDAAVDRTNSLYVKWSKLQGENYYVSSILYMIYASGIHRQKDMSDVWGMPKQTVNTVITELVKNGDILLTADEKDKRSKRIELTKKGVQYAKSVVNPLIECEKKVIEKMGEARVRLLIETLSEYAAYLEEEMELRFKTRQK